MRSFALPISLLSVGVAATNIVVSNDDGWAAANVRQFVDDLADAGHSVVLSAPALNQSGRGSSSKTPTALNEPCEFDTCPKGSPAWGHNATDTRLNYVNGYPVDATKYGVQTLAPQFFNGSGPDLMLAGPNADATNVGLIGVLFSGTVGAACEGARSGIPSIAFSGASGDHVSYTTLSDTSLASTRAAQIYSTLSTTVVNALTASGPAPYLPPNTILNVNFAGIDHCPSADAFKFVFSRVFWNPFVNDAVVCGSDKLPSETRVMLSGCYASISVMDSGSKLDVSASVQSAVFDRLQALPLACLD